MPRCTNCRKTDLDRSYYNQSQSGTEVVLKYTGESVGGQAITAPSGRQYIFSALRPQVVVDGGDMDALLKLGYFARG
jgi:hypothetical protein